MLAKITAYYKSLADGGCSDFSMNVYYGGGYRSEFYLCGDLGRSTFDDIIETDTDATGQTKRTQNTSIERFNLSVIITTPLIQFLKTIDKCDVKELTFLDTGEIYDITNIDIEDQGDNLSPTDLVNITFEDKPITKIQDIVYLDTESKLAFWDVDNSGTPDINGNAVYQAVFDYFRFYQLYFEADSVTPATSGNVTIQAYAVRDSIESLIGIFRGEFGDTLSDPTKWQSSQGVADYFNPAISTIGHTEQIRFDKQAFAQDNGYYSDEIEDRAVNIRFELSIDGSAEQQITLDLVYTLWGAFSSSGVQSVGTGVYGITTVGKTDTKNTISTIQDVKVPLPLGTQLLITSPTLTAVTNFSNKYTLWVAGATENYYEGTAITAGGYTTSNFRGAFETDNFTFSVLDTAPIQQSLNVLNFTTGNSPFLVTFQYKYDRQTNLSIFPQLGDITAAGAAEVLLDGVLVNNIPAIAPGTPQVIGTQSVTLPDAAVHKVRLTLPTTNLYEIYTEFELQIKPLF